MSRPIAVGLGEWSMRFDRPNRLVRPTIHELLARGLDAVAFTEAPVFHLLLASMAKSHGYTLLLPREGDTAVMVRADHHIVRGDYRPVVAAARHPTHGPRGIQVAELVHAGSGDHITVCAAHWLTHRADQGGQRLRMTAAMASEVAAAARGSRLAFWLGDTNTQDTDHNTDPVSQALDAGRLTSCWDELGRYPATHGDHTIDVVGSYDLDGRVACTRATSWDTSGSDHRPIAAWYLVQPHPDKG